MEHIYPGRRQTLRDEIYNYLIKNNYYKLNENKVILYPTKNI